MARLGGRGCPNCGSHDTHGLARHGAWWCTTCDHRWVPHSASCRGWDLDLHAPDGPLVVGCVPCGVPNRVARTWPEAWRDLAKSLDGHKMEATVKPFRSPREGVSKA